MVRRSGASCSGDLGSGDDGDAGVEETAAQELGNGERGLEVARGGRGELVPPGRLRRAARGRRREVLEGLASLVEGPRVGDCVFGFPTARSRGEKDLGRIEMMAIVVASADGATGEIDVNWGEYRYL